MDPQQAAALLSQQGQSGMGQVPLGQLYALQNLMGRMPPGGPGWGGGHLGGMPPQPGMPGAPQGVAGVPGLPGAQSGGLSQPLNAYQQMQGLGQFPLNNLSLLGMGAR